MSVEDSDKQVDWEALREKIGRAININAPYSFGERQRVKVVNIESLGTSSNPIMRRATYAVYKENELQGYFVQTLVFSQECNLERIANPHWT
jgi:hypothetical protein